MKEPMKWTYERDTNRQKKGRQKNKKTATNRRHDRLNKSLEKRFVIRLAADGNKSTVNYRNQIRF